MFIDLKKFKANKQNYCPTIIKLTPEWCKQPSNKNSSSKWKKLAISLYLTGYDVLVKESGDSKYMYIADTQRAMKIRVSNHPPAIPKCNKRNNYFNTKFGNVSLLVGPRGVSCKEAFQLIKETLRG